MTSTTRSPGSPRCSARSSRARRSPTWRRSSSAAATTQVSFTDQGITDAGAAGRQEGRQLGLRQRVGAVRRDAEVRRGASSDISLIQQAFDMNGFLSGDIDAAQAMTYNEYAQVLETTNPDTGELYTAGRSPCHRLEQTWARRCCRTPSGPTPRGSATLRTPSRPRGSSRPRSRAGCTPGTTPSEAATIVTEAGSQLGESHQLWHDQRGEQADLAVHQRRHRDDLRTPAWDQTVDHRARAPRTRPAPPSSPPTRPPPPRPTPTWRRPWRS